MIERTCRRCGNPFKVYPSSRQACCSLECRYAQQSDDRRGIHPYSATSKRVDSQKAEYRAQLRREFGELSVREIELFKRVYWTAYQRGYNKGIYRRRSTQEAA